MEVNSLSFLTVTYWNDFDLLDQQLTSFDNFYQHNAMHYIVLNDDVCHLSELKTIVKKHRKNRYCIMHRSEIYDKNVCSKQQCEALPGWYSQQILKLFSSAVIDSTFYCVLDSKSYFNQITRPSDFVKKGMAVNIPEHDCNFQGEFVIGSESSYKILQVNLDRSTLIQSVPPVVMKTDWVQELLHYLNSKNLSLAEILLWYDNTFCTEFYLYSAWIAKNSRANEIYWSDFSQCSVSHDHHKTKRRP